MNLTKKIGLATAFVLTSSFANAAVYNLGTGSQPNTINTVLNAGNFLDEFTFTLAQDSFFSALALSSTLPRFGLNGLSIFSSITIGGYSGMVGMLGPDSSGAGTDSILLGAGNYTLFLEGSTTIAGTEYLFTSSVSPVPEPSSIALMLGGLGLVGFMATRRTKKV